MSQYQRAQLNVATMKFPLQCAGVADFVANPDRINALAESSPAAAYLLLARAPFG